MKIKLTQNKLSKTLNNVSKITGGVRSSLPILNNVLIRVDDKRVSLITTNLDMAIISYLPSTGSEKGTITAPAKLVAEFVSNLPSGSEVKLISNDTKLTIKSGEYTSVINGTAADDFPELPEIDEEKMAKIKIPTEVFKDAISQVMVAASNDTTRPALTGVYFNTFEKALYFAATDGYRLAERKVVDGVAEEISVIIPAVSLRTVVGLLDDNCEEIELLIDDSQTRFRFGDIEITSKLIDGSFPDYRQLIPKESEINLELKKDELTRVTKLAALFAREVGGSIVCLANKDDGNFSIASVANELGENSSKIATEVDNSGKITLNSRFLLDALNVTNGEKIEFKFSNNLNPIVIRAAKNQDYVHIIMPLKG